MRRAAILLYFLSLVVLTATSSTPQRSASRSSSALTLRQLATLRKAVNDRRRGGGARRARLRRRRWREPHRREMNAKLASWSAGTGEHGAVLLRGHGVALGAENYLPPRDYRSERRRREPRPRRGVPVDTLSGGCRGGAQRYHSLCLMLRDNPIAAAGVRSIGGTRGLTASKREGRFRALLCGDGANRFGRLGDTIPIRTLSSRESWCT